MPQRQFVVRAVPSIAEVDAAAWDACAGPGNPFLSHAFLRVLEESGSATAEEGWMPQHLVLEEDGAIHGCAPLYLKGHSYGEYVFDWSWASAYKRARLEYYPKLQCCVPFTPAGGPRLLVRADHPDRVQLQQVLCSAMLQLAQRHEVSSLHITFQTEDEHRMCTELGMLPRLGVQYHWHNRGYGSFEDFLANLVGRKRKAIKKERREAHAAGLRIRCLRGPEITAAQWKTFHGFYEGTIGRKWGSPYLTRRFFPLLGRALGDRVVLVVAESGGKLVAGALNLLGEDALYGRYWGCGEEHRFLHFELCYHQAIDLAIELRLPRVEAGAQGQHKIQRGYVPVPTYSSHWVGHPRFAAAIAEFLEDERPAVRREIDQLMRESPFSADRARSRAAEC